MKVFVSGATKTLRRLANEYKDVLGFLYTPTIGNSIHSVYKLDLPVAADNAAFSGFNGEKFYKMISGISGRAVEWCVCPDVIGDHNATIKSFNAWEPMLRYFRLPVAFVLQNGCKSASYVPWDRIRCVFIGGDDEYKLSQEARSIVEYAKANGFLSHMGRVNSYSRMHYAHLIGCDSVDGTSCSMFPDQFIEKFAKRARLLNSGNVGKDDLPLFEDMQ